MENQDPVNDTPDIVISGGLGFYAISGLSEAGREWIQDYVQGAEDGQAYCDDTRMTQEIYEAAKADFLTVEI